MRAALVGIAIVLAGCPKGGDSQKTIEPEKKKDAGSRLLPDDEAGVPELPPPPPLPSLPNGLPPLALQASVTPASVALGELLFYEPRLSSTGTLACASCHEPEHDYGGTARHDTAAGKPNVRRAPALVNVAWQTDYGWDGRYATIGEQLTAHVKGQLGDELAAGVARILDVPMYRAEFARVRAGPPSVDTTLAALAAFVLTRYAGDAPWDRMERSPDVPADIKAGYQLFSGKAQCSVCHTPPLYTDLRYHRLGLIAVPDEGRGRVDPGQQGAFKTPTLRGASARTGFFHDGSVTTLDAAIDWHLAGGIGQGADPSIVDIKKIALSPAERAQLGAFVGALRTTAPPPTRPALP
jgi:cytochrome c peroxidase